MYIRVHSWFALLPSVMRTKSNQRDLKGSLPGPLAVALLLSVSAILFASSFQAIPPAADNGSYPALPATATGSSPTLGNYPDTSTSLSSDATVTPDAAPTNVASINVSTSTNFQGTLAGDPTTGVVRVTDAHPAGTYTVTVRAFNSVGLSATRTFTLTVTTPATCTPVSFATVQFCAGDFNSSIAVVGDFNGDGKQDLAVTYYTSAGFISIVLGDGAGHFSAPTNFSAGAYPGLAAVGDFNGDGKQDLAVPNFGNSGGVSILLGDGAGNFSAPIILSAGPGSVAVGDFNGDGKQDLAVANRNSNSVSILLGDGAGSFGAPTNFPRWHRSWLTSDRRFQWRWQARSRHSQQRWRIDLVGRWRRKFQRPAQLPSWH